MTDPIDENRLLKSSFGETGDCLPLEILSVLAEDPSTPLNAGSRQHLEACAHCRNEFELLREFQTAALRPEEAASVAWISSELLRRVPEAIAPERVSPWDRMKSGLENLLARRNWRTISLACASLLVAITAGVYVRNLEQEDHPSGGEVWRTQQLTAVSPVGDVAGAPLELKWRPADRAARYRVRVLEVDRSEIWAAETQSISAPIPAEIRSRMAPGRTFLWEVTALDSSGTKIGGTNLQNFHISITPLSTR